MEQVTHGRKAEFEEVALPLLNPLFNLALNLTRNPKDAEDLVQETYLRAYRFFDSYQRGTHVKAWLFRILRNTFINRYRAAKVRPDEVELDKLETAYEKVVDKQFLHDRQPASPEAIVMDGVLDGEVEEAIAAIPEEYRTVVLLALVQEMSYKEISHALSIPLGTVMSRLHRGRKLLQAKLFEYAHRKGIIRSTMDVSE
ncbi:MAG: sigma-70 family RNA polymerase sigma factor [Acidobacteriota bacterium]|nr:sigma-70 family RNA polymerase sigma factor [Acidobacteriota bacterium]